MGRPFLYPCYVFLDRDGTLIEDRHYLSDPDGVALLPGAGEALGELCASGLPLFLVTNQSGIGRGYFAQADMEACQARLEELLAPFGAHFTDTRFCPHTPTSDADPGHCSCRKPQTGMWKSLRDAHGLAPSHCVMIGDKRDDMLFGINAGFAAAFLVQTGKGKEQAAQWGLDLEEGDDLKAFDLILHRGEGRGTTHTALYLARDLPAVVNALLER